ncbi:MAG: hypothetical protein P8Y40_13720, partial [Desulfobacterales bacterium]
PSRRPAGCCRGVAKETVPHQPGRAWPTNLPAPTRKGTVPIWALGGTQDSIAPPLQATGHMEQITSVPPERKLILLCDGGHMGLFRSRKILQNYYTKIAAFLLAHSDRRPKGSRRKTTSRPG